MRECHANPYSSNYPGALRARPQRKTGSAGRETRRAARRGCEKPLGIERQTEGAVNALWAAVKKIKKLDAKRHALHQSDWKIAANLAVGFPERAATHLATIQNAHGRPPQRLGKNNSLMVAGATIGKNSKKFIKKFERPHLKIRAAIRGREDFVLDRSRPISGVYPGRGPRLAIRTVESADPARRARGARRRDQRSACARSAALLRRFTERAIDEARPMPSILAISEAADRVEFRPGFCRALAATLSQAISQDAAAMR